MSLNFGLTFTILALSYSVSPSKVVSPTAEGKQPSIPRLLKKRYPDYIQAKYFVIH